MCVCVTKNLFQTQNLIRPKVPLGPNISLRPNFSLDAKSRDLEFWRLRDIEARVKAEHFRLQSCSILFVVVMQGQGDIPVSKNLIS